MLLVLLRVRHSAMQERLPSQQRPLLVYHARLATIARGDPVVSFAMQGHLVWEEHRVVRYVMQDRLALVQVLLLALYAALLGLTT